MGSSNAVGVKRGRGDSRGAILSPVLVASGLLDNTTVRLPQPPGDGDQRMNVFWRQLIEKIPPHTFHMHWPCFGE